MKQLVPWKTKLLFSQIFATIFCCVALSAFAQPDFGKSYINVTKGLNGGTIENGDTLEIRASFVVKSGTYDSCGYTDVIPAGTTYIPGTLRVLTNEGKIYKQFTEAYGDDPGYISGSNITIHLGYRTGSNPATAFRRGRIANTYKPSFYGSACIMIASFRVVITAATGTNISMGGGAMTYKSTGGGGLFKTYIFPTNTLQVYKNYGICANTVGTNAIGTESNGTFGNGKPKNRGTSANVPPSYTYIPFGLNSPNDYYYNISNNTSTTNYTTSNAWPIPDGSSPTHRVFGVWDIIGDHTGAASPTAGNPPADTVNGTGGYMLVINSAYKIDSAFMQTISGLCPNTYYEISCWMRSICSHCGCDSNGKGASGGAGYIPTAPGDSSGVYPNLTFEVDGIDYYTTGNITYTGEWVKKGFTYLTGPLQTGFALKFFNNAPGGGGNDWALDDITVATCSPSMKYSPSNNPTVCQGNIIPIYDTVTSYFNNYTYYKWQRSTDAGSSWSDVTGALGPSVPDSTSSGWQYGTTYTVPPANTNLSDSGDLYRVVVATTVNNLSDVSCRFTDAVKIITLNVIDCGIALNVRFISFTENTTDGKVTLNWTTSQEPEPLLFDVERSYDGINFTTIATLPSHGDFNAAYSVYSYTDPEALSQSAFYRITMKNNTNELMSMTRIIEIFMKPHTFSFMSVINPFNNSLVFDLSSGRSGKANMELVDQFGKIVRKKLLEINTGINHFELHNTDILPAAIYIIRIQFRDAVLQKKVLKQTL